MDIANELHKRCADAVGEILKDPKFEDCKVEVHKDGFKGGPYFIDITVEVPREDTVVNKIRDMLLGL